MAGGKKDGLIRCEELVRPLLSLTHPCIGGQLLVFISGVKRCGMFEGGAAGLALNGRVDHNSRSTSGGSDCGLGASFDRL